MARELSASSAETATSNGIGQIGTGDRASEHCDEKIIEYLEESQW